MAELDWRHADLVVGPIRNFRLFDGACARGETSSGSSLRSCIGGSVLAGGCGMASSDTRNGARAASNPPSVRDGER